MTDWSGRIQAEHLGAEAVLLDLGGAYLVGDHPPAFGGSGRGPMPGDLIKGALASSAALALGAAADRGELSANGIYVRCSFEIGADPTSGPMPVISYLSKFLLQITLAGLVDAAQIRRAEDLVRSCRVARALTGAMALEEVNQFSGLAAGRPREEVAMVVERSGQRPTQASLIKPVFPASSTEYIGAGRALVNFGGSTILVEDASHTVGGIVTPETLVIASLATCTTVFAARALSAMGAPAEIRVDCEGRFVADAPDLLSKRLEVIGDLTPTQQQTIAFCADHCAIGETLRRPAGLAVEILAAAPGRSPAAPLPLPAAEPACDDGVCCAPEITAG